MMCSNNLNDIKRELVLQGKMLIIVTTLTVVNIAVTLGVIIWLIK